MLTKKEYEKELARLQTELVRMQEWVVHSGLRVDGDLRGARHGRQGRHDQADHRAANPRHRRVVALGTPTERERTQWYFQRYVAHLPAAGEIVLFDRSWYNRAGVERVMGFCTDEEYEEFLRTCPQFERELVRSGIILIKYWLSVSDEEQERRFQARIDNPAKRWKLSPMDLEARARWVDYAEAKDEMFAYTDIQESAVVRRRRRRQEGGAAEPDQPPAEPDPLRDAAPREDRAAAAAAAGLRAPAGGRAELDSADVCGEVARSVFRELDSITTRSARMRGPRQSWPILQSKMGISGKL